MSCGSKHCEGLTERGILSGSRFCYVFPCELRVPAWAVGSYSISHYFMFFGATVLRKVLHICLYSSVGVILPVFTPRGEY